MRAAASPTSSPASSANWRRGSGLRRGDRRLRLGYRFLQARIAVAQHLGVELVLRERLCCAGEDAIELLAIKGDQQKIHAGIERFGHGGADLPVVDRAHDEVVG